MNYIEDWTKVGTISVDSGSVMIGDPCYTQGADASSASKDWMGFLAATYPGTFGPNSTGESMPQVTNALGEQGLGIVSSSGFGDGEYPVYVRYSDEGQWGKRVAELKVVFIGEEEEEEEDE